MLQKSKDKEYSNFWQASSQEQTKLSLWAFATKYRGDYCFFLFQFQFKQTNISHLGLRRCEAKNWGFLEHIQCLGSIDTIEHALALCWSWVSSSLHSASWRSSHPPPDARAHAFHLVHLRLRGVTEHISAKPVVTCCDLWDFFFFWRIRLTDPTPAARTPAVTAVAPAPTKRVAMANALNGIANAAPPLPCRNHATPAATCARSPPPTTATSPPPPRRRLPPSPPPLGYLGGSASEPERVKQQPKQPRNLTDMWDPCGRGGPSQATDMWVSSKGLTPP